MDPGSAPPQEGGSDASSGDAVVFGVVTVSDRASAGTYSDLSGPAILQFFSEAIKSRCSLIYIPRMR
jgi:molybdopterin adenylyltransferase